MRFISSLQPTLKLLMWASVTDRSPDLSVRRSLISPSPLNCPLWEQQTLGSVRPAAVPFPSFQRHFVCLLDLLDFMGLPAASHTFLFPTFIRVPRDGETMTPLIRRCGSSIGLAKLVEEKRQTTHKRTPTCTVGRLSRP